MDEKQPLRVGEEGGIGRPCCCGCCYWLKLTENGRNQARIGVATCCDEQLNCEVMACAGGGHGHGPVPTNRCVEVAWCCCWIIFPIALFEHYRMITEQRRCTLRCCGCKFNCLCCDRCLEQK